MKINFSYFEQQSNQFVFLFSGQKVDLIRMLINENMDNSVDSIVPWHPDGWEYAVTLFIEDKNKAALMKLKY